MRDAASKSPEPSPVARDEFDVAMRNTKRLADQGVPIGVGSDGGSQMDLPGLMTHRECELLVAAGFTPAQALVAATANGGRALGRQDLGRIAPGALADLVLLDADPLASVANLRRISRVMLDGAWVRR
jgi:imidazolonepropionase-like amidohydrolase